MIKNSPNIKNEPSASNEGIADSVAIRRYAEH